MTWSVSPTPGWDDVTAVLSRPPVGFSLLPVEELHLLTRVVVHPDSVLLYVRHGKPESVTACWEGQQSVWRLHEHFPHEPAGHLVTCLLAGEAGHATLQVLGKPSK